MFAGPPADPSVPQFFDGNVSALSVLGLSVHNRFELSPFSTTGPSDADPIAIAPTPPSGAATVNSNSSLPRSHRWMRFRSLNPTNSFFIPAPKTTSLEGIGRYLSTFA